MTPDGWRKATYGQAMVETDLRAGTSVDLPVLSVTKSRGPMLASERFAKVMHGRDLARYRVAPRQSVVADPMLLWDGSIGLQTVVEAGLVSPDYRVYQPADDVDPQFLGYVVRSPRMLPHYQGGARGTNVRRNRIARTDFLAIPLPLPPVSEQRKIAVILSSVDRAIKATQAVIAQLQVVKKAMMAELLTRGLPGKHTRFKQTDIGEVPEEWPVLPLDELIAAGRPICYGVLKPGPHVPNGIPVVRITDYRGDRLDVGAVQRSASDIVMPFKRSSLREGDLLISIRGTAGRVCMISSELEGGNISRDSARISLADPDLRPYIYCFLRSPVAQGFVFGEMRGMAVQGINIQDLRRLPVPLPSTHERTLISDALSSVDDVLNSNGEKLEALRSAKDALMSVLLTGEVRVNPDEDAA